MQAELEPVIPQADDGFHVHDAATANWVVRKITEARLYAERVKEWAELERRRARREEEFLMRRFGAELEAWTRQQIDQQHGRNQTINLPAGRIGFRTESTRLAITDEQRLIAWCPLESAVRNPLGRFRDEETADAAHQADRRMSGWRGPARRGAAISHHRKESWIG